MLPCYESVEVEEFEVICIDSQVEEEFEPINCQIDYKEKYALLKPFMELK